MFDQEQMKILRGNSATIAEKVGCSRRYVSMVLNNRVTKNTKKALEIKETASQLLAILQHGVSESVAGVPTDFSSRETVKTSLRKTYPKEKVLNELNDYFVSMIAHELSTPLTTIIMSVDLLDAYYERMSGDEITQKILQIKKNAVFLKSMIDNISDLSLLGKGEIFPGILGTQ